MSTKNQINQNQLNMFENTTYGYMPAKEIRFYGSDLQEKDQKHFKGQMQALLKKFADNIFRSKLEWIKETGFTDVDRLLRYISEGKITGFIREKKKFGNLYWKYRIVKLDK